jgi:hypothetical protein
MKHIAIILAILTIAVGERMAPLPIVVNGIEVEGKVILSILSITLLGIVVLIKNPS